MQKYANRKVLLERDSKFKAHIQVVAPSKVRHINRTIFDDQQRYSDFVAEKVMVFIQLKLQLDAFDIAKVQEFIEIVVGGVRIWLIRFISAGKCVDHKEPFHQLPFVAIVWILNGLKINRLKTPTQQTHVNQSSSFTILYVNAFRIKIGTDFTNCKLFSV